MDTCAECAESINFFKGKYCSNILSQIISKMETSILFTRVERDSSCSLPVFILRPVITFHLSSPLDLNGSSRCVEESFAAANPAVSALPCPAAPNSHQLQQCSHLGFC
ncbi:hypothetical protein ILYODFUR_002145 [Ilyodon furcidens]|uniref:Uncharacterized protein n=1 Tax=Ilyodon furcidens TaxID=33524 RepID=A0ABV0STJ0_9TELE